jgi:DeoR/GlpR family transcriptional regulator of sugar metabolism
MCSSAKIGKEYFYNVADISQVDVIISDIDVEEIFKTK